MKLELEGDVTDVVKIYVRHLFERGSGSAVLLTSCIERI